MRLNLGVLDVAYGDASSGNPATTTGFVAGIIEQNFHVMEIFFEEHKDEIANWLAESVSDRIQDVVSGAPVTGRAVQDAEQNIEKSFRRFLSESEIEKINPDTPTQAALEGRTKRRKSGKGPRRPSFVDTGTYQAAFRAWIDQD